MEVTKTNREIKKQIKPKTNLFKTRKLSRGAADYTKTEFLMFLSVVLAESAAP